MIKHTWHLSYSIVSMFTITNITWQDCSYSCWSPWVHWHECGAGDPGDWHQSGRSAGTLRQGWKDRFVDFFFYFFFYKIHIYFFTQEFLVNLLLCMRHSLKVCLVVLVLARLCWLWSWSTMWRRLTVVTLCLLEWAREPAKEMTCTMRWLSLVSLTWRTRPQRSEPFNKLAVKTYVVIVL